nr:phenylalanine--tRNA ligase subunit beta [Clostridia bacterium]
MILSLEWLREFIEPGVSVKEYCDRMTATGSKVECWEELGEDIQNVLCGRILTIEKHPDADKLLVTTVDVGEAEPRQIVTGAHNIEVGMMVPVACAPAILPNDVKIKKGKLRGVESNGMFCSIEELNLTVHDMPGAPEDGILPILEDCKPGDDVRDVLKLRDTAVEFEITPNRPDCLSVIGLARETAASFNKKAVYHTPKTVSGTGDISEYLTVENTAPELCPRYAARVVRNVKIAPSPLWLRMRLRASGVRPINNIVDITNYVMLEYGQPMHAFDYSCIDGKKIVVRTASEGEQFKSLDDIDHTLRSDMLVIADEKKPVALAGIMGGANSEIKDDTATVVFESANFNGPSVRITGRALGMRTESSGRFEKGLDAENALPALERACELVEMLGAGEVVGGCIDLYPGKKPQTVLKLDAKRINETLGVDLTEEYMADVLKSLDFTMVCDRVVVPSWRGDVECMNDLAEEVLRIYGYDTIKPTLFKAQVKTGKFTPRQQYRHRMADLLCSLGMNEIVTFSFISPRWYDKIGLGADDKLRKSVVIRNPLGEDTSVMRTTLLPSLVDCLARNGSTHGGKASLYEIAAVYRPTEDPNALPDEHLEAVLGTVGSGDFYSLKGICEAVFADAGISGVKYVAE